MTNDKSIMINLGNACNFDCKYCYQRDSDKKTFLPQEAIYEILNIVKHNHTISTICLLGGEPLLRKDEIKYILDFIRTENSLRESKLSVSIITNGSIYLHFLKDYKDFLSLQISVDGGPSYHNKNRIFSSKKGTYDEVILGIKMYSDDGLAVNVHSVIVNALAWLLSLHTLKRDLKGFKFIYGFNRDLTKSSFIGSFLNYLIIRYVGEPLLRHYKIKYKTPETRPKGPAKVCPGGDTLLCIDRDQEIYSCEIEHEEAHIGKLKDGFIQLKPNHRENIEYKQDITNYKIRFLPKKLSDRFLAEQASSYVICSIKNKNYTGNIYTIPLREAIFTILRRK